MLLPGLNPYPNHVCLALSNLLAGGQWQCWTGPNYDATKSSITACILILPIALRAMPLAMPSYWKYQ